MAQHPVRNQAEFQAACDVAKPGDKILLHGGTYDARTKLTRSGTRDRPIVICMADDGWLSGGRRPDPFRGDSHPADEAPSKPTADDPALLYLEDCRHVTVEGIRACDFWPVIFNIRDASHLVIRDCTLRHATFAIFAKGEDVTHLLIDHNTWQQDDSPDHLLWTTHDWARAHGGEGADGLLRYFNGGFLAGKGIRGNVILRRNRIMDAYNGIRLKWGDDTPKPKAMPKFNADIHIYDNDFIRIRDNPIEPEICAFNWHVRHNRMLDCHSWFSVDGVTGGYWYFYGNTGQFTSRQGLPIDHGHTMGRVLKLSYQTTPPEASEREAVPIHPWYVFNNSWHLRCPIIGGAQPTQPAAGEGPDFTAQLAFFNNAFQWCDPRTYGDRVCESVAMILSYDPRRGSGVTFDYTLCDRPDYLAHMHGIQSEANGLEATRPIFAKPVAGRFDFKPAARSQALNTGLPASVQRPHNAAPAVVRAQANQKINRGALQDYGLTAVPELEAEASRLLRQFAPAKARRRGRRT
jgi:hypothetical protein